MGRNRWLNTLRRELLVFRKKLVIIWSHQLRIIEIQYLSNQLARITLFWLEPYPPKSNPLPTIEEIDYENSRATYSSSKK